jgi:hypothetical protein
MTFPIENRSCLAPAEFASLRERFATHTSVKHGLDWFLGMTPPVPPVDCVAQDEFSHDVIFPHPDGFWVVYECT